MVRSAFWPRGSGPHPTAKPRSGNCGQIRSTYVADGSISYGLGEPSNDRDLSAADVRAPSASIPLVARAEVEPAKGARGKAVNHPVPLCRSRPTRSRARGARQRRRSRGDLHPSRAGRRDPQEQPRTDCARAPEHRPSGRTRLTARCAERALTPSSSTRPSFVPCRVLIQLNDARRRFRSASQLFPLRDFATKLQRNGLRAYLEILV